MPDDIHPQIQTLLEAGKAAGLRPVAELTTQEARDQAELVGAASRAQYPPAEVASIEAVSTGPGYGHVPVRIYRNSDRTDAPVIVYYHGGGHVICSLDTHEPICRQMAVSCDCVVVSVDYRMGPEHPFPAAVEDCFDATRWVADRAEALGLDATRLAVAGDSAGGNLAAVVSLMAKEAGAPAISAQVLVYPVIDYTKRYPSHERYGEGYGVLELETEEWFAQRYLNRHEHLTDWRAAPDRAPSHEGLPPALLVMAECDILYDEGVAYGARLAAAGVPVEQRDFAGMVHAFFGYLGPVDGAMDAHEAVAEYLGRIWGRGG